MSIPNRRIREHLARKPKAPSFAVTHLGDSMLHTARDLDDACQAIIFNKRRDNARKLVTKQEEEHKTKVAAVSLPKLKWMGQ